jgi:REP element-mobilizing transposase RayT
MRPLRLLQLGVWYHVRTRVNNRESLFRRPRAVTLFDRVFRETGRRFAFKFRGLRLEDDWLTFYVKPADGMELPEIMKWLKQTFAQRYNGETGRIGHIWGDRYGSEIVEGEPPEKAEDSAAGDLGVRPFGEKTEKSRHFSLQFPLPPAPSPGIPYQPLFPPPAEAA